MKRRFLDRVYKDTDGKIVIVQFPNLPISTWLICTLINRLLPGSSVSPLLTFVGTGALFTWAWLELFNGVTYVRRLLGLIVLMALLQSHL